MSKRVLLIGRNYYPSSVPASHRMAKMAKYLPKYGWVPTVLCAKLTAENSPRTYDPVLADKGDLCETVRVSVDGYLGKTRVGRRLGETKDQIEKFIYPDKHPVAFCRRMLDAAERLVSKNKFDAIWATAPPTFTHFVASEVSQKFSIPWVADFRDLADEYKKTWTVRREVQAESRICANAKALIAVTPIHVKILKERHNVPVHLVFNGYDPEDYVGDVVVDPEKFVIGYFGHIEPFRNPRPLFEALDMMIMDGNKVIDDIVVLFFGALQRQIQSFLKGFNCSDRVQWCPRVGHSEMIRLQRSCSVLLLLKSREPIGTIGSKAFDYLATGRPILNVPGDGDVVDKLLAETQAGISLSKPAEIASALTKWHQEWKTTGSIQCRSVPEVVEKYSREKQAEMLGQILDSVVA